MGGIRDVLQDNLQSYSEVTNSIGADNSQPAFTATEINEEEPDVPTKKQRKT